MSLSLETPYSRQMSALEFGQARQGSVMLCRVHLTGITKTVGWGLMSVSAAAGVTAAISSAWVFVGTGVAGIAAASVPVSVARTIGQAAPDRHEILHRPRTLRLFALLYATALTCIIVTVAGLTQS